MKVTTAIKKIGYGLSGDIGGLPRKTYYTPDGREIKAIPSLREYAKKDKKGEIIERGTRDANLDKGWLETIPQELKLYCAGCDMWHDTQEEVDACMEKKDKRIKELGGKLIKQETDDIDTLKKEVAELRELLQKALGDKND